MTPLGVGNALHKYAAESATWEPDLRKEPDTRVRAVPARWQQRQNECHTPDISAVYRTEQHNEALFNEPVNGVHACMSDIVVN